MSEPTSKDLRWTSDEYTIKEILQRFSLPIILKNTTNQNKILWVNEQFTTNALCAKGKDNYFMIPHDSSMTKNLQIYKDAKLKSVDDALDRKCFPFRVTPKGQLKYLMKDGTEGSRSLNKLTVENQKTQTFLLACKLTLEPDADKPVLEALPTSLWDTFYIAAGYKKTKNLWDQFKSDVKGRLEQLMVFHTKTLQKVVFQFDENPFNAATVLIPKCVEFEIIESANDNNSDVQSIYPEAYPPPDYDDVDKATKPVVTSAEITPSSSQDSPDNVPTQNVKASTKENTKDKEETKKNDTLKKPSSDTKKTKRFSFTKKKSSEKEGLKKLETKTEQKKQEIENGQQEKNELQEKQNVKTTETVDTSDGQVGKKVITQSSHLKKSENIKKQQVSDKDQQVSQVNNTGTTSEKHSFSDEISIISGRLSNQKGENAITKNEEVEQHGQNTPRRSFSEEISDAATKFDKKYKDEKKSMTKKPSVKTSTSTVTKKQEVSQHSQNTSPPRRSFSEEISNAATKFDKKYKDENKNITNKPSGKISTVNKKQEVLQQSKNTSPPRRSFSEEISNAAAKFEDKHKEDEKENVSTKTSTNTATTPLVKANSMLTSPKTEVLLTTTDQTTPANCPPLVTPITATKKSRTVLERWKPEETSYVRRPSDQSTSSGRLISDELIKTKPESKITVSTTTSVPSAPISSTSSISASTEIKSQKAKSTVNDQPMISNSHQISPTPVNGQSTSVVTSTPAVKANPIPTAPKTVVPPITTDHTTPVNSPITAAKNSPAVLERWKPDGTSYVKRPSDQSVRSRRPVSELISNLNGNFMNNEPIKTRSQSINPVSTITSSAHVSSTSSISAAPEIKSQKAKPPVDDQPTTSTSYQMSSTPVNNRPIFSVATPPVKTNPVPTLSKPVVSSTTIDRTTPVNSPSLITSTTATKKTPAVLERWKPEETLYARRLSDQSVPSNRPVSELISNIKSDFLYKEQLKARPQSIHPVSATTSVSSTPIFSTSSTSAFTDEKPMTSTSHSNASPDNAKPILPTPISMTSSSVGKKDSKAPPVIKEKPKPSQNREDLSYELINPQSTATKRKSVSSTLAGLIGRFSEGSGKVDTKDTTKTKPEIQNTADNHVYEEIPYFDVKKSKGKRNYETTIPSALPENYVAIEKNKKGPIYQTYKGEQEPIYQNLVDVDGKQEPVYENFPATNSSTENFTILEIPSDPYDGPYVNVQTYNIR